MLELPPHIPELFVTLSQRFGLLLAGGLAVVMLAPLDKIQLRLQRQWEGAPQSLGSGRWSPADVASMALLAALFGMFSILGTYSGNLVFQSFANLRAMGVIAAGLFGGPVVGGLAGLIAGGHRYLIDVGGFSAFPCGLATLLEGLGAGLFAMRYPALRLDWRAALGLCMLGETMHMGLVLALARPFADALDLVRVIGVPMILINSIGAALIIQALRLQMHWRDMRESAQARTLLSVANQTVGHLRRGLTLESAAATAAIIKKETGAAAVAVTDLDTVLAHLGEGSDHHLAGEPVRTDATRRAIRTGTPMFLTQQEEIGCRHPGCPLHSAIIVPLFKGERILGCLKLYGARMQPLNKTLFEVAKGLANLFSTQIELEDIGVKNQLLAHAEIRRLQAQINPHFLFNSLNTVASFCRTDPAQARELILDLSNYMRRNLDSSRGLIPLREELEQVRCYLMIEQARFGERIQMEFQVDPDLEDWPVPPLLIQPLVENGVRHGILRRTEGGAIRLVARQDGQDHLAVLVEDDGTGMSPDVLRSILRADGPESLSEGVGARNCNQRLVQLFGPSYAMRIHSAPGQGTRIHFRIPRLAAA
ncbi:LytS/YhcK type 5TM receptor domain-containing protein [Megalodesulfovibrio gigas]|uniref:LytS/YhcK type 5TM receptor domain-containing protein n=1 Tax=Megalodesulfovibrio gigas TaxID=879 RepID=UPI000403C969|nr:LytS/YhcK type 5TM receptor domain-containing protein [Megalodesulfovibrio gigas]